ncbi:MAG: hypothetical protein ACRESC_00310 [Gammaproteobacteria bacterium]
MDVSVKFPPTISAFMQDNSRQRWILGPFGSGKSVGSQIEIPRRAEMQRASILDNRKKTRIAVVRNTMPQLRDTTMKTWFDWFPNGSLGEYTAQTKTYLIKKDDINCEVIFRALDDPSDVSNLLSIELTGAYLNEFRDIHREIAEALDGRLGRYPRMAEGGPSWVGMWGDSNMPEHGSYWYCMLEGIDPNDGKTPKPNSHMKFVQSPAMVRTVTGEYIENPNAENLENLPRGYYPTLIKDKTDDYIRTYVMCEYGRSKGGKPIHPMFNRAIHVSSRPLIPNKNNLLLVSADFGLTPALVIKQQDAFGRVLAFDSIATFGMGIERAIETKLIPLIRQKYDGFDIFVTGDPSGGSGSQADETSCVDIFRRYRNKGLGRVKLAWSNALPHRIGATDHFLSMLVDRGMAAYQIDPGATELIAALEGSFMWKKFKDGRPSDEIEKNEASHIGEANQYGDMYFERGGRRKAELKERAKPPDSDQTSPYCTPR